MTIGRIKLKEGVKIRFGGEWAENGYNADAECDNCNNREGVLIKHGVRKPKEPLECPRCKCKTLRVL